MITPARRPGMITNPPAPVRRPEGTSGVMGNTDPATLAMILSSLQAPEQQPRGSLPATTFPESPRAMNPAFAQMLMQMLQGSQGSANPQTLGSLFL